MESGDTGGENIQLLAIVMAEDFDPVDVPGGPVVGPFHKLCEALQRLVGAA